MKVTKRNCKISSISVVSPMIIMGVCLAVNNRERKLASFFAGKYIFPGEKFFYRAHGYMF